MNNNHISNYQQYRKIIIIVSIILTVFILLNLIINTWYPNLAHNAYRYPIVGGTTIWMEPIYQYPQNITVLTW